MLTGPQRKFCALYAVDQNATAAYRAAYPKSSAAAARSSAAVLLAKPSIQAEIARIRAAAEKEAGSAVLTLAEKREFLARLVRAEIASLPENSDLFVSVERGKNGVKFRLGDKLKAIEIDNDLSGEGKEAEANDAVSQLLAEIRK